MMQPAHASPSALLRLPLGVALGGVEHVLHRTHSPGCSASESLAVVVGAVGQAGFRYVLILEEHHLCLSPNLSLVPTTGKAVSEREKRETSGVATPSGRQRCETQTVSSPHKDSHHVRSYCNDTPRERKCRFCLSSSLLTGAVSIGETPATELLSSAITLSEEIAIPVFGSQSTQDARCMPDHYEQAKSPFQPGGTMQVTSPHQLYEVTPHSWVLLFEAAPA